MISNNTSIHEEIVMAAKTNPEDLAIENRDLRKKNSRTCKLAITNFGKC